VRGAALIRQKLPPTPQGRLFSAGNSASKSLVTPNRERVVSRPQGGAIAGAQDNDMPTPIPFADDGGTPAWRARHALHPALRFPIWRFLVALAALPFLLVFMAAASWLSWMCFQGVMGPPGAIIALVGIAALAALIRCHTGMALGAALSLVALVGLAGLVWVVFALLAVGLVAGV
jgi:hypothetical protein